MVFELQSENIALSVQFQQGVLPEPPFRVIFWGFCVS